MELWLQHIHSNLLHLWLWPLYRFREHHTWLEQHWVGRIFRVWFYSKGWFCWNSIKHQETGETSNILKWKQIYHISWRQCGWAGRKGSTNILPLSFSKYTELLKPGVTQVVTQFSLTWNPNLLILYVQFASFSLSTWTCEKPKRRV